MDHGQRAAEQAQAALARRLRKVYGDAVKEIDEQLKDYAKSFAAADAKMRKKLADGKITKDQYAAWQRAQAFQGRRWRDRRDMLAGTMYDADKLAQRIINGERLNVFTENMNSLAYDMEHGEGLDFGFGYYDSSTVARLLAENPDMLPPPSPKTVRKSTDIAWYNSRVNNAITRGIIQGKSIPDIAGMLARETGETAYKAALRNARTAMTGAQNAGRIAAMQQAQRMGIKVQKRWMCTLDGRTRDAHRDMDGQVRDVDKPFDSDFGRIGYPGDPTAHPANVYNCRCTLLYVHPEYPSTFTRRDQTTGDVIGDMTYRDWEKWKLGANIISTVKKQIDTIVKPVSWKPTAEQTDEHIAKADYFREIGAKVDHDGNVTIYHATTSSAATIIKKVGFKPNEDPINGMQIEDVKPRSFFGWDKQWIKNTWATNESVIMEVKVPAYYLHQAGQNTDEIFIEGWLKDNGGIWIPDEKPTSLAWDRRLVKRWKKRKGD